MAAAYTFPPDYAQNQVVEVLKYVFSVGESLGSALLSIGLGLAVALLIIRVAWIGTLTTVGSKSANEGMLDLLMALAIGGVIISCLLPSVGWYVGATKILMAGFDTIAKALTAALGQEAVYDTDRLSQLTNPFFSSMDKLFTLIGKMWSALSISFSLSSAVDAFKVTVVSAFILLILLVMIVSLTVAMIMFMLATVQFAVGVAFGPILIPFYLFKPLESALDRWFMFLVSAAMNQVMVLVLMAIAAGATAKVVQSTITNMQDADLSLTSLSLQPFFVLVLVALLVLLLIAKSEQITNALLPGNGAVGLASFVRNASSLGRASGSTARGAGNAVGSLQRGATSAVKGAVSTGQSIGSAGLQVNKAVRQAPQGSRMRAAVQATNNLVSQKVFGKSNPAAARENPIEIGQKIPSTAAQSTGIREKLAARRATNGRG
jgi:type IV secretory pathway VirB6-like protein